MPSFIPKGASQLLYPREQKLYQSSTLCLLSLGPAHKPVIPGCFSSTVSSRREDLVFIISLGGLAKKLGSSEGWERDPDFCRKNEPSLSKQPMQGNQPLHNTHSWNCRCQMINCFISPSSFENYFSWDVYFNPQVISRLFPNTTRNNWIYLENRITNIMNLKRPRGMVSSPMFPDIPDFKRANLDSSAQ